MDWRAALVTLFAAPFAGVVVLAIINRRTLFGDPVEDITDEHTQGHGVGGANIFNHGTEQ